jgi:hypothetical protein
MKYIYLMIAVFVLTACGHRSLENANSEPISETSSDEPVRVKNKISGASLEMPSTMIHDGAMDGLAEANIGWVSHIPFGMTREGGASVSYHASGGGWWGETIEGTTECVRIARAAGLKSMIKPHVWVIGQGWPGHFDLDTEKEWLEWESTYREYIMTFAKLADSLDIELFCIGTEYRIAVVKRKDFWVDLIKDIRAIYKGKLTYASNWDNYEKVKFWDKLDYIGVDAYFPTSKSKNPSLEELIKKWEPIEKDLAKFSQKHDRSILFTEFGFKSCDYVCSGLSDNDVDSLSANMNNQAVAYKAFFKTIWQKEWMAGSFFWKWHLVGNNIGGPDNKRYTPQGKTALEVIRQWYGAVDN